MLPAYVVWRTVTTNRVVVPPVRQAGNRFLGLLKRSTGSGGPVQKPYIRTGLLDYTGRRNQFLGIASCAS
jgi:hypothetical protein